MWTDLNWQDVITDDEIVSDTWELKEVDGVVYEIDAKKVSVGGNVEVSKSDSSSSQQRNVN